MTASGSPAAYAGTPRPNPFALPADTFFRFGMLVMSVLSTLLVMLGGLARDLSGTAATFTAMERCYARVTAPPPPGERGLGLVRRFHAAGARLASCPYFDLRSYALVLFGLAAAFTAIALIVYWLMPVWRIRREGLVRLPEDAFPGLAAYLEELRTEAGVARVTFLAAPLDPRVSGLAFGRVGRRYVVLRRGLLDRFDADRPLFRAIVLHELAHLRNRDLDPTYLSVAIWRVFVAICLVPAPLHFLVRGAAWVPVAWRLLALTLLVLLIRNAVLRTRELHADARVGAWGSGAALLRALGPHDRARRGPRLLDLMRAHPVPARRRAALDRPDVLLTGAGWWDGVALGISSVLTYATLTEFISWALHGATAATLITVVLFLVPAGFCVARGVTGRALTEFVTGRRQAADAFGLGLGAGIALSVDLDVRNAFQPSDRLAPTIPPLAVGDRLVWIALVTVVTWLLVRWLTTTARMWLPLWASRRGPARGFVRAGLLASAGLGLWVPYALSLFDYGNTTRALVLPEVPASVIDLGEIGYDLVAMWPLPLVVGGFLLLWAIPILPRSRAARRITAPPAAWVSLGPPPPHRVPASPERRARVAPKVIAYGVGGVWLLSYLTFAVLWAVHPPLDRHAIVLLTTALAGLPGVAAVLCGIVAAVLVTARASAPRAMTGLRTAFVTVPLVVYLGELGPAGVYCLWTGYCAVPVSGTWWWSNATYRGGLAAALLAALITGAALARRRRPTG